MQSLDVTLKGYTNAPLDESIDSFRAATLPLLKACGVTATVSTRQRAVPPEGRAAVHVTVDSLRSIEQPIRLTEEGLVRRIRGVAWTMNMGPQNAKAAFSSAKGILLKLLADVQIFTDVVSVKPKPVRTLALPPQLLLSLPLPVLSVGNSLPRVVYEIARVCSYGDGRRAVWRAPLPPGRDVRSCHRVTREGLPAMASSWWRRQQRDGT